ncbi:hypothetical protein BC830DRAFT_1166818 [Chytriomyces sp. MP71]|nr:hypothetical protein BC830DRAFT_1166818 [Chytriomyces sp. MP71]
MEPEQQQQQTTQQLLHDTSMHPLLQSNLLHHFGASATTWQAAQSQAAGADAPTQPGQQYHQHELYQPQPFHPIPQQFHSFDAFWAATASPTALQPIALSNTHPSTTPLFPPSHSTAPFDFRFDTPIMNPIASPFAFYAQPQTQPHLTDSPFLAAAESPAFGFQIPSSVAPLHLKRTLPEDSMPLDLHPHRIATPPLTQPPSSQQKQRFTGVTPVNRMTPSQIMNLGAATVNAGAPAPKRVLRHAEPLEVGALDSGPAATAPARGASVLDSPALAGGVAMWTPRGALRGSSSGGRDVGVYSGDFSPLDAVGDFGVEDEATMGGDERRGRRAHALEKRRLYRKQAEKLRRDLMKDCFDEVKDLLPRDMIKEKIASKETILAKAVDYISELKDLEAEKVEAMRRLEDEVNALKRSVQF